jgi:tetratricopeptide (TPR) repeat protein
MNPAADAALKSALKALEAHDPEAAIATLAGLLADGDALDTAPRMLAHGLLGPALAGLGRLEEARGHVGDAIAFAQALGDPQSIAHYQHLMAQLGTLALSPEDVEIVLERAMAALDRGEPEAAEAELETVLVAALGHGLADLEATARGMLGQAMMLQGQPERALPQLQRAVELAREMGDPGAEGHFAALLAAAESPEGARRYQQQGDVTHRAELAADEAGRALEHNDWERAVGLLAPLADEARDLGATEAEATLRGVLAQAWLAGGMRQEAIADARRALTLAEQARATEAADAFRNLLQLAVGLGVPVERA